jgi:hypothetical protein
LQILTLYAGFPHILLTSKRSLIADFVAVHGTSGHYLFYFETTDFVAIRTVPAHFAYFAMTLDCRFCLYIWDSGAFFLLRNDPGLQILSLYASSRALVHFEKTLDCRFCFCIRDSGAFVLLRNGVGLQILSLYTALRGIRLTSKRHSIADFVGMHGTPGHLAYSEMTLDY